MSKPMRRMLLVVGFFIFAIGIFKFLQIRAAIAQGSSFQPPPETVTTVVAQQENWTGNLNAIGSVAAVHGVVVSADLAGIVKRIEFQSGRPVRTGQTLVRLDVAQEQAQLAQAVAQRDLARLNLERAQKLLERKLIAQSEFDRQQAEARSNEANVRAIQAVIARKTIRAPFTGVLGIRQVNLGEHLNEGDPIVPLQSLDPIYVNFSLPQQDVAALKVGGQVHVQADSITGGEAGGKITAINSVVDAATRNVEVQATMKNPDGRLRPGMFVDVRIGLGTTARAITLPISSINYAPYGNSVFVVETLNPPKGKPGKPYKGVSQRFVTLGQERGDQVAVVAGLRAGEEIVTSGVFKLRTGMAVRVDNRIQPSNNPAPRPEDS